MESPDDHGSAIPEPEAYALLNSFTEFLTIAIHSLLFHRGLYPPATFLAARAYNLPVHQSRHPRVCAWINDAVAAVTTQLRLGNARRVVLVVHGLPPRLDVLERWVFDVAMFPAWGGGGDEDEDEGGNDADTAVAAAAEQKHREGGQHQGIIDEEELSGDEDDPQTVVNWTDVNEALRGALRRVAYAGESIPRLPEGCTFTLALELRDQAEAPIGHPQPWIPAPDNIQPATPAHPDRGSSLRRSTTRPIRSVRAGPLFFECWLEQNKGNQVTFNTDMPPPPPRDKAPK